MTQTMTVIKPPGTFPSIDIKEIWRYRELFYIFAWRDLKVRFKQTILGVLWVVLQPLLSTFIFTVFFGLLSGIPSNNLPYPLFVLIGLVFWNFFSHALVSSSNSLIDNEQILKKIYFPKIILPLAMILTALVDFIVSIFLLFVFTVVVGYQISVNIIIIILIAAVFTIFVSAGAGLFFSSLNVKYRDVRYALPYFFQLIMFLTPVIYSLQIVSPSNAKIMALNPMTSIIETVRAVYSGSNLPGMQLIFISFMSTILICCIGLWYFRRTEYQLADIT